jgi:hypothetical protein
VAEKCLTIGKVRPALACIRGGIVPSGIGEFLLGEILKFIGACEMNFSRSWFYKSNMS